MNRKLLIVLLLLASVSVSAKGLRYSFAVEAGGGLGTLLYTPAKANLHLGGGGSVGAACVLTFAPSLALRTGLQLSLYTASATGRGLQAGSYSAHDSDENTPFTFGYEYTGYTERLHALMLALPVMLQVQSDGDKGFCAAIGVKVLAPLRVRVRTLADNLETWGQYKVPNDVEYRGDLPEHGFVSRKEDASTSVSAKIGLTVSAEIGWRFAVAGAPCYAGAYFDYGLTSLLGRTSDERLVLYRPDSPQSFGYNSYAAQAKSVRLMGAGVLLRWFFSAARNEK